MDSPRSEALSELPPSAKLVYKVLEYQGAMTQQEIAEESLLSSRTIRYALHRLDEIDALEEEIHFADARQSIYRLAPEPESGSGNTGPCPAN